MTTPPATTLDSTALSDRAISYRRTVVPTLWGAVVATILRVLSPHLPGDVDQALADLLGSELALTLVHTVAIAAWYWLWRRLEHRIPDWVVRLVLGSSRAPGYALPAAAVVDGTPERRDVEPDDDTDPGDDEPAAPPA